MAKKKTKQPENRTTKPPNHSATQQPSNLPTRPPVVVVLGHIDHGKTTLLDCIRKTQVAAKEAGGITQKIGAYQVEIRESENLSPPEADRESGKNKRPSHQILKPSDSQVIRRITFIDTPGHEAFAKMRGRGAKVADIAVLVVAADDGVMPQTKEAIAHAHAAEIPIVVALNKIDLKNADPKKVKGQLVKEGLVPEDQGGDTPVVPVSAKTGEGVPELLEMISLVADLLELKSEPQAALDAVVIESSLSSQRGPLATVVLRGGTLKVGEAIYAGEVEGKVKALFDSQGGGIKEVLPGMPAEVLGFSVVPPVGAEVSGERIAEGKRAQRATPSKLKPQNSDLNVVLRCDTQGSLEAIRAALTKILVDERRVNILLGGIGQVGDSDVYLAHSAGGAILGFNVAVASSAQKLADDLGVGVRTFTIIYELLEVVERLLKGAEELAKAKIKGEGEVIKTFLLLSGDVVLGVRVTAGKIKYRDKVKIVRGEEEIHEGRVRGLKLGKEEIPEAKEGQEVGVLVKPQFGGLKVKDRIVVL